MWRLASVIVVGMIGVALWFTLAPAAQAGGVVGTGAPGSCTDAALNTALAGGGSVTFDCGGPATIVLLTPKYISLNTQIDGGGVITLSGGLATRLFRVDPAGALSLSNLLLDKGFSISDNGGAISSAGQLSMSNVTVQNSLTGLAPYCGGALFATGNADITNVTFSNNETALGGGAICVRGQPGTQINVTGSTFAFNRATDTVNGFGGAIYVEYGTVVVFDSGFVANGAHMGGAVYAGPGNAGTNAVVTLDGTPTEPIFASPLQLNANGASQDGGAVYNKNGHVAINNAVITVNKTPTQTLLAGFGGAIHNAGVLTLTNSLLSKNEGRYGGGLFVGNSPPGSRAWIENTKFDRNISGNLGGGLYTNEVSATVTVSNSVFSGNTAGSGGGLARFNSALNVYDSSFTGNTGLVGGGLFLGAVPSPSSGPHVRVQNVTISGNTAGINQGGGVWNSGGVELYSTTIVSNTNGVFASNNGNTRFRNTVLQNPGYLNCDSTGGLPFSDDGYNYSTDNSCPLPNANSHTGIGLDPLLGPLATDTFQPTSYHMPLAGSPLIDTGFPGQCSERDQRGALRVGVCDIGAVEYGGLVQSNRLYLPVVERE